MIYHYHQHASSCAGYVACGSTNISEIQGSWDSSSGMYINSGRHCNVCGFEQKGGASWNRCPNTVYSSTACGKSTSTIESVEIIY